ncbi:Putative binding domain-containing protein, N-terminal [Alistipes timonensis JC136]|uniref:Putative binding domain-containing protein, N-terminal n=2 Tax=Alistipes timonensis TaxID=1465754 RepID=A0A1H4F3J8_9BACT|nr:Putative binding domain-containing protein, N-terminal [Alistipes timonensis JC136]
MAFMAAALLASCSDKDNDYSGDFGQIKVPDTRQLEQTVTANDTQTARGVTFTTEGAWTSTIAEKTRAEAPDWIGISPDHGDAAGSYTLKITLQPNDSEESRTATIVINCGTSKIEITVTQEGTDNPVEPMPANRITRIESRQQTIRNSGDSDPERWTSTSHFAYDDAGRLTSYEWDDTPENTDNAMDEVLRISYPDAKTLKLSAETTESPEKESYTVTLNDAGRAVAARSDDGPERWTFAYDGNGCCKECTYEGDETHYYPRTVCRWSGNDLTGLDIYREQDLDFSYEFEYHTDRPNTPALCNLDLNALLFDVCPDIEDADFFMGSVLSGIGRLGNRSAHLTNTNPDESVFVVEQLPDGSFRRFRVLNERIEWKQVDGRITEVIWSQEVECFLEKDGKETVIPEQGYKETETHRIFY